MAIRLLDKAVFAVSVSEGGVFFRLGMLKQHLHCHCPPGNLLLFYKVVLLILEESSRNVVSLLGVWLVSSPPTSLSIEYTDLESTDILLSG